jgi:hypothetical protein
MRRVLAFLVAIAVVALAPRAPSDPGKTPSSPQPGAGDWKEAKPRELARPLPTGCEARSLREWLRLRCTGRRFASVGVISGDGRGVAIWVEPGKEAKDGIVEIILPLRPGDRRILQVTEMASDVRGTGDQRASFIVSEQWVAGEPAAVVVAH